MGWLVLGAAVLIALLLGANRLANADPKSLVRGLKWLGIGLGVLLAMWLAATGRAATMAPMVLLAIPFVRRRLFAALGGGGSPFGVRKAPSGGQSSDVETAYLRMTLDHDSGEVEGQVLDGRFKGRSLATLGLEELLELREECGREDPESLPLVEAYLDRAFADWRAEFGAEGEQETGEQGSSARAYDRPMTKQEAWGVLDLAPGASAEEIRAAHHRLMKKVHPDQGGSNYLASKINQAKDVLLAV